MRITVVIDNYIPPGSRSPFLAEHGLSMLIEKDEKKILMDCGQTAAVLNNLHLLGYHASDLDAVVISHGHYDHTGGLCHILQEARKAIPVYIHPAAFKPRFSLAGNAESFIGIPNSREQLAALGADWRFATEPVKAAADFWVSGAIPRVTPYWQGDTKLVTKQGPQATQDRIEDDLAAFCVRDDKLIVISGCAHSGMINIIRYGLTVTSTRKLAGWVGGTHLGPASRDEQEKTLNDLLAFEPEFVAANHCTALPMMTRLSALLGARFKTAFVGSVIEC